MRDEPRRLIDNAMRSSELERVIRIRQMMVKGSIINTSSLHSYASLITFHRQRCASDVLITNVNQGEKLTIEMIEIEMIEIETDRNTQIETDRKVRVRDRKLIEIRES